MQFKDLPNGTYKANVYQWGITEVEINGSKQPKLVVKFMIKTDLDDQPVIGTFDSFINTKDGLPNKKTIKTALTCGFQGPDWSKFNDDQALDKDKDLTVTIQADPNGYKRIEWVNEPGSGQGSLQKVEVTTLKSPKYKSAFEEAKKEMGLKARVAPKKVEDKDDDVPW